MSNGVDVLPRVGGQTIFSTTSPSMLLSEVAKPIGKQNSRRCRVNEHQTKSKVKYEVHDENNIIHYGNLFRIKTYNIH